MNEPEKLIQRIQEVLQESAVPAWLLYGFRDLDPLANRILRLDPQRLATRRWMYLVPRQGEPRKLVHKIEDYVLDHLPGETIKYSSWGELHQGLESLLAGVEAAAMQYSEKNANPYVARVDAGTVELVSSFGTRVVSSGDLLQRFESVWSAGQIEGHRKAARHLTEIVQQAFAKAADEIRSRGETSEFAIQSFILERFGQEGLTYDHPANVSVNENSANPHYEPSREISSPIKVGDFLLIDLWARPETGDGVFADITWTAYLGDSLPEKIGQVFEVVRSGRDRGVEFLMERLPGRVEGWEVDDAVRGVLEEAGYARYFVHRTGHNLGEDFVHGNGVHFDNLETHDTRPLIPGLGCTIEPGIYLPGEFGVRSEINVVIAEKGPEVTTPPQKEVLLLL